MDTTIDNKLGTRVQLLALGKFHGPRLIFVPEPVTRQPLGRFAWLCLSLAVLPIMMKSMLLLAMVVAATALMPEPRHLLNNRRAFPKAWKLVSPSSAIGGVAAVLGLTETAYC